MAWSTFFGVIIGAYAIYYVLNVLYDLFLSSGRKATAQSGVHYNLDDLASDEEQPSLVSDDPEEERNYNDQGYEEEEEFDDDYDDEQEQGYADEMEQEPAPALKVEGQGISLDEFLKDAQSYSKTIF